MDEAGIVSTVRRDGLRNKRVINWNCRNIFFLSSPLDKIRESAFIELDKTLIGIAARKLKKLQKILILLQILWFLSIWPFFHLGLQLLNGCVMIL